MRVAPAVLAPRRLAVALLLLALVVRVGFVLATPGYELRHDDRDYDHHARSIAHGGAFPKVRDLPSAYRPPAFPYVLGGIYAVVGRERPGRVLVARLALAALGTLIAALIALIARRVWNERVALVALAVAAVHVPLVLVGGSLISEPLFVAFELAALLAVLVHRARPEGVRWAVAAGVLGGLAWLTRSTGPVLVVALALGVGTARPWRSGRALIAPAALVAAALLTVAPWTLRNAVELDAFVPVSTQGGGTLAGTYNEASRTSESNPAGWLLLGAIPQYADIRRAEAAGLPEPEVDARLRSRVRAFVLDHPLYPLRAMGWNTVRLLDLGDRARARFTASTIGLGPRLADLGSIWFWVAGVLALGGALTGAARGTPRFLWATAALLFLGTVVVVSETPRFRAPLEPFVVLLAAVALVRAWERWRRRATPGEPVTAPGGDARRASLAVAGRSSRA